MRVGSACFHTTDSAIRRASALYDAVGDSCQHRVESYGLGKNL